MVPTLRGQNDELVCSSICFARSVGNPHNLPKTSNLVLNLCLNPEPPSYSAISYRGLCNPSRNRLEELLNERSKVLDHLNDTTLRGHGHCVLSQTHLTGATRIPQIGLGCLSRTVTLRCCYNLQNGTPCQQKTLLRGGHIVCRLISIYPLTVKCNKHTYSETLDSGNWENKLLNSINHQLLFQL
jgi:hypothetical protein